MPTYEYECCTCGRRFERRQSIHDEPIRGCPECEGAVRRVIHPVGIVFKGSGFYITDNRPKSSGEEKRTGTTDSRSKFSGDGEEKRTDTTDSRPKSSDDGGEKKTSVIDDRPKSSNGGGDKKTSEVASATKD